MEDWDYETHLDGLDYTPQQNRFFEMWQFEGAASPDVIEGDIDSKNLAQWLKQTPPEKTGTEGFIGGLRILYSSTDPDSDASDDVAWLRSDFERIMTTFNLPKRYSQILGEDHCVFAGFRDGDDDVTGQHFKGYIFSTMFHHNPFWALAASYDPASRTTNALLHSTSDSNHESLERLKQYLVSMAPRAMHPLLLPVLITDLETTLTLRDCIHWNETLAEVENETGQNPNALGASQQVDPLALDFASVVQRLNGCSMFVYAIQRECEGMLEQLAQMAVEISESGAQLQATSRRLKRHIHFVTTSRKMLLIRLNKIQHGTQTQLAAVYNFIAQRDMKLNIEIARESNALAIASRRDSSFVKTVAVLAMLFLSGAFIAVCANLMPFHSLFGNIM